MPDLTERYNPNEVVKDGPFTAPRKWQHLLKVFVSLALYVALRDLGHLATGIAALLASPVLVISIAIKEWSWPSDPNEHTYSHELRLEDFLTDFSCTIPVLVCWLASDFRWWSAAVVAALGLITYFSQRHGGRP